MTQHPLEPLSADEFRRTTEILRREGHVTDTFRFASIELMEPAKQEVLAWRVGDAVPRHSFAVVWNRSDNKTYEATVDLTGDAVLSFKHVPDVTPNFTVDEFHEVDAALHKHPAVRAKLRERGISDMSRVIVDVWTYGKALMPEKYRDRRLGWCDLWVREIPDGNPYAHPVSGLKVLVDMNTLELLEIEDQYDVGMPAVDGEYVPGPWKGELRTDLKPLHITQPEGASFTVDGTELRWQNWSMRLGFNYREGPVIYQLAYDDHGVRRDVAYRMSFAEMVVPYRDPTFDHYRRTAYDIGEWGLGFMATSLELRLRLPRRDRLRGRGAARRRGCAVRHQERDLPTRGGQRRPLEARRCADRCRGPPAAAHGGLVPRHRRELRVPRLLALLPGRQHRVRGTRDRHHGHHPLCRGRGRAALRDRRRQPHLRAVPSALPGRPPRP